MAATSTTRYINITHPDDGTTSIITTAGIDLCPLVVEINLPDGLDAGSYFRVQVVDSRVIKCIESFYVHTAPLGGHIVPMGNTNNSTDPNTWLGIEVDGNTVNGAKFISISIPAVGVPIPDNSVITMKLLLGRPDITHS